ncbi:hypothetical protein ACQUEQ_08545 [Enterococcus casseliflavus]|uniref:hypothetical protein n=1 Tax=Enterococcus TaxID=1350 RepID=UPI001F0416AB|nr:hypothetical protein [Enterococcus gallinarum]
MNNYLVTFEIGSDVNSSMAVKIRSKLEKMSTDNKWIHIFPNQLAIQTELSIDEVYNGLQPENDKVRIMIAKFDDYILNNHPAKNLFDSF